MSSAKKKAVKKSVKRQPRKAKAAPVQPATMLVLRTCDAKMQGHGGFQWPRQGPVECPDWSPTKACGNGLHGLPWGNGDVVRDGKLAVAP